MNKWQQLIAKIAPIGARRASPLLKKIRIWGARLGGAYLVIACFRLVTAGVRTTQPWLKPLAFAVAGVGVVLAIRMIAASFSKSRE